jgi:hypothetical protein
MSTGDIWTGTRRRLLRLAAGALAAAVAPRAGAAGRRGALLADVRVGNGGRPFARDGTRLTTVSRTPLRSAAELRFRLSRRAAVTVEVFATGQGVASEQPVSSGQESLTEQTQVLEPGSHVLPWTPTPDLRPRTYVLRLTATTASGREQSARAVVRLLGVDAGFAARSAAPGESADLLVRTDAQRVSVRLIRCGFEQEPTYANNELKGTPVTQPVDLDWTRRGDAAVRLHVRVGDWPSGVYAARLDADDGRIGFAPLLVRPAAPRHRVAVVLPTTTWQAYNFYDADGDGWGDTWYARWQTKTVDLGRPHANRGVPYRFRSYDLGFQHWLAQSGKEVDVYADEDLERFSSSDELRAAYDLLVFPGHTEYVTARVLDLVTGFRDRGGNLAFLSANNFFRRVDRDAGGRTVTLVDEWRTLGRPEAALCGVQYIGGDRGERHAPFTVVGADVAPWAFEGTGLQNGSQFGLYGIEIDARAPSSPLSTQVLASIPDLFGTGRTAEMSYYEHPGGARVFSAGALNFGGEIMLWPETRQLLDNVWLRLAPAG